MKMIIKGLLYIIFLFVFMHIGYMVAIDDNNNKDILIESYQNIIKQYYNNDKEYINDSMIIHHSFWYDCIISTDAYYRADSIQYSNWNWLN